MAGSPSGLGPCSFIGHCSLATGHRSPRPNLGRIARLLPHQAASNSGFDASDQNAARGALQLAPLASGNSVDYLFDGSARAGIITQPVAERPSALSSGVRWRFPSALMARTTVSRGLAAGRRLDQRYGVPRRPRRGSNAGVCSAASSVFSQRLATITPPVLNLDLGPFATRQPFLPQQRSAGFGGAVSLWTGAPVAFGVWHTLAAGVPSRARQGVRLLRGRGRRTAGGRRRQPVGLRLDSFALGAPAPTRTGRNRRSPRSSFMADLAEFSLYGRALSEADAGCRPEDTWPREYAALLALPPPRPGRGAQRALSA